MRWSALFFVFSLIATGCLGEQPDSVGHTQGALTPADGAPASNPNKEKVCHHTNGQGHILIEVSANAAANHLDPTHGHSQDLQPGAGGLNCVCEALTSANVCVGAVAGTECSDDDACTDGDGCDGSGSCQSGAAVTCDTAQGRADGSLTQCQSYSGACLPDTGCVITDLPDGSACSDGDPSTCESCQAGVCAAEACAVGNLRPGWDVCDSGGGDVSYAVTAPGGTANNFSFTVSLAGALPNTSYDIYLNDYGVQASSWDGIPSVTINPAPRVDCDSGVPGDGGTAPHPAYILHTFTTDASGDASFTTTYTVPAGVYELQTALTLAGELPARYKTGDTFGSTETVVVPNLTPGWDVCDSGGGFVEYTVAGAGGTPNNFLLELTLDDALPNTAYDVYLNDYGVQASSWDGISSVTINPAPRVDCNSGVPGDGGTDPHPAYILTTITTDAQGDATFNGSYSVPAGVYELQTALTISGELPARFKTGDTFGSTDTVIVPNLNPGWDVCDSGGGIVDYTVVDVGGAANNFVFDLLLDGALPNTTYDIYLNDYGVLASSWDGIPGITINPATRIDCDSGVTGTGGTGPHPAYVLGNVTTDSQGDGTFTATYTVPTGIYELQTALTVSGAGAVRYKTGDTFGSTETVVVPNLTPGWDVCDSGGGTVDYTVNGAGGTPNNFGFDLELVGALPNTGYDIYLNDYGVLASSWDGIPGITINPAIRVDCNTGDTGNGGASPHPAYVLGTITTDAQGNASFSATYTVPSGAYALQTALTVQGEGPARYKTGNTFGATDAVVVP